MTSIYITHCSKTKNKEYENSNIPVTPDILYKSIPISRFMNTCKSRQVNWAIFSDKYGIIFPIDKIHWYEKSPNSVTDKERKLLLDDFLSKLSKYEIIYFYNNPGRFHHFYKEFLIEAKKLRSGIILFSYLKDIK